MKRQSVQTRYHQLCASLATSIFVKLGAVAALTARSLKRLGAMIPEEYRGELDLPNRTAA